MTFDSQLGLAPLLGDTSPGLKTVVPNGAVATYIRFFRHPGHHHFFIIFSIPFYVDLGSILDPNLDPKSLQNPWKIDPKSDLENIQLFSFIFNWIFMDFGFVATSFLGFPFEREAKIYWFSAPFWVHFRVIFRLKSIQNDVKNDIKKSLFFYWFFYWFLTDFGLHLGAHFPPKSIKIRWGS